MSFSRDGSALLSRLAPLPIVALAFAIRSFRLPDTSIWYDEGLTVWAARSRLIDMVRWTSADVHPPLYFALMHFWRRLAGDSEFAVRFPSVVFGVLSVLVLWKLGRALLPKQPLVATLAALFLALSRFSVWWSQEARMYELAALLALLNLLFAARVRRRCAFWDVVGYLAVTIAAFWTLYLLAFLLVADGVYWLLGLPDLASGRERLRLFLAWAGLEIVAVAGVLPWLAYALPRMHHWSDADATTPIEFVKLYASLLSLGISTNVNAVQIPALLIAGIAIIGCLIAVARRAPGSGRTAVLLLLAIALPPLILGGLMILPRSTGYVPRPQARYLLPYAGAFSLLVAWALDEIARFFGQVRRPAMLLLVLGVAGLQVWSLAGYEGGLLRADDYISIAATLHAYAHPGDAVLLDTDQTWPVFAYHWNSPFVGIPDGQTISPVWIASFVRPVWSTHDATWLVINERALRADPQHQVEDWLRSHAVAKREWRFGTRRVVLFARTPTRGSAIDALVPDFQPPRARAALAADGLTLVGWEQPLYRSVTGDVLNLAVDVRGKGSSLIQISLGDPAIATATANVGTGAGTRRVVTPLIVPANAPGGRLPLVASISGARAVEGWLEVVPRGLAAATPTAAPRIVDSVSFGQPALIRLVGYDASTTLQPGRTSAVTLYWQDVAPVPASYKVFVHYLDATNHVAAQHDDFPVKGSRPTTSWLPGETIVDHYQVPIPPDLKSGRYTLEAGLYDPATGKRLGPVVTADGVKQKDDRTVLGTADVK